MKRNSSQHQFCHARSRVVVLSWILTLTTTILLGGGCKLRQVSSRSQSKAALKKGGMMCSFQGSWTQDARTQLGLVRSAMNRLAEDPKCGEMARGGLQRLKNVAEALPDVPADEDSQFDAGSSQDANVDERLLERQMEVPGEMVDLVSEGQTLRESSDPRTAAFGTEVLQSAVRRGLELESGLTRLVASRVVETTDRNSIPRLAKLTPGGLVRERLGLATRGLITAMDGVLDDMAKASKCMPGTAGAGASRTALFGGVVRTLAAAARSDAANAEMLTNTVVKAVNMASATKYFEAQSQLDQGEMLMQMGCLLESISANYCAARDMQAILQSALGSTRFEQYRNPQSPYFGFYLARRALPVVSDWLGGLIFPTVTDFRAGNMEQLRLAYVFEMSRISRGMRGIFKNGEWSVQQMEADLKKMKASGQPKEDLEQARQQIKGTLHRLIREITSYIAQNTYLRGSESFSKRGLRALPPLLRMDLPSFYVPLRLIGIEYNQMPEAVRPRPGRSLTTEAVLRWMAEDGFRPKLARGGEERLTVFDDPEKFLNTLRIEVEKILANGTSASIDFYIERANIDYGALIARFSAPDAYGRSVESSFVEIKSYLVGVAQRYRGSRDYGFFADALWEVVTMIDETVADMRQIQGRVEDAAARNELIKRLLTRFRMLEQYNSFLPARVAEVVTFDFHQRARSLAGQGGVEIDWMALVTTSVLEALSERYQSNPNQMVNSLAMAQKMNLTNLTAYQKSFGPQLMAQLRLLQAIENGKASPADVRADSLDRAYGASHSLPRTSEERMARTWRDDILDWIELTPIRMAARILFNPSLYPMPGFLSRDGSDKVTYADDKYSNLRRLRADLCLLTLSLPNPEAFWDVCRGANRISYWHNVSKDDPLTESMSVFYDAKIAKYVSAAEGFSRLPAGASTAGICLYHDAKRREMIYWNNLIERSKFSAP